MVLVKATKESEAGVMPSSELLMTMGRFNEEIAKAAILESGGGLKPSPHGVRVRFSGSA
ncbi:MAG: YciI family protein, partial [Acetobacteraceae bacterium]|nr:YciI family protein [Acetobacteraceae bacterium]